jgi:hypothetical protein
MPRYFTLQQAEKLLPEVEFTIREAICQSRVTMQGGMRVDHAQVLDLKRCRESAARLLKEALEKIQEYGCVVKDLDIGLIDFPTLFRGEEVYLCWKLGESGIGFWHGVHEGFRGRKPIDAKFLAEHRGE